MKRVLTFLSCLFITGMVHSQSIQSDSAHNSNKIKLVSGQKIVIENSTEIEASLSMGMELNGSTSTVNMLDVKNITDHDCTISNTLTKLKANMNMMGQGSYYDSENKESNNEEMAKLFDNTLNNPVDVILDNSSGMVTVNKKKEKKIDTDQSNPAAGLMNIFSNNSDESIVKSAFELIPPGKSIGDSWSDTTKTKEMKMIRNYTLKSVSGNEAVIELAVFTSALNKLVYQEMEFEIKSETKTKGEIITDIQTGLTKKRTTSSEISGAFQMMGQDMPISGRNNATIIYK